MTTYWVGSSAKGTEDGSSYANAIGTLDGAIALCDAKGDILNVIADGDHTWPTSETDIPAGTIGDNFTTYGTLIRGVTDDATGDPALASVVASGGDAARFFFRAVDTTGYIIVRNLEFDATGKTSDASTYYASRLRDTPSGSPYPGPIRFEACSLLGGGTGATATTASSRRLFGPHATSPGPGSPMFEANYCYFQNCSGVVAVAGATVGKAFVGCVFYNDFAGTGDTFFSQTLAALTGDEFTFTNNTIYETLGNNAIGAPLSCTVGAGLDAGTVTVMDNLVYLESSSGAPAAHFMADGGAGDGSFTGTIDYNGLIGGASVAVGDLHAEGWYHDLWDTVAHANDTVVYEVAEASLFSAPGSTYAWNALGNGVELTVLKDLRPILYTASSSTGGVLGALPIASTNRGVTITSDRAAPRINETVVYTITATNTGVADTGVAVTAAIPSGVTIVGSVASAGTYDETTWTLGAFTNGASETLVVTVTVDADQGGQTIAYPVSITGDLTDSSPGNDTDTTSISVQIDDPISGDDSIPTIDVRPIFAPVMKLSYNLRYQTKMNRVRKTYIRKDIESAEFREMTSRRIVLATNTTTTINMGGIERAKNLLVESDVAIQVGIGTGSAKLYPASTAVALVVSDFEILQMKNPSTTDEASILMVVSD